MSKYSLHRATATCSQSSQRPSDQFWSQLDNSQIADARGIRGTAMTKDPQCVDSDVDYQRSVALTIFAVRSSPQFSFTY